MVVEFWTETVSYFVGEEVIWHGLDTWWCCDGPIPGGWDNTKDGGISYTEDLNPAYVMDLIEEHGIKKESQDDDFAEGLYEGECVATYIELNNGGWLWKVLRPPYV